MSIHELPPLSGALGRLGLGDLPTSPTSPPPVYNPAPRRRALVEPVSDDVDWHLVVTLRREAAEQITRAAEDWLKDHGRPLADPDRRVLGRSIVRSVVHARAQVLSEQGEALWPLRLENRYADAVENAIFGYGRLQPLFELPTAENIEIHGHDNVWVQHGDGRRHPHPPVADSDEELVDAIRFLGETA
ncbi:MAG TPA: secretion protein, partial [Arachnia sp.]|nr:secretion protein [Arachnia sp.]HMR13844.1 secretion protein [Arachnia sp.]